MGNVVAVVAISCKSTENFLKKVVRHSYFTLINN